MKIETENLDNKKLSDILFMILKEMEEIEVSEDTKNLTGDQKREMVVNYIDKRTDDNIDVDMIGDIIEMIINISNGEYIIQTHSLKRLFSSVIKTRFWCCK